MVEILRGEDRVRNRKQPHVGVGKVVYADASLAVVYFKNRDRLLPEDRLSQFRLPADFLELVPDPPPDAELDLSCYRFR